MLNYGFNTQFCKLYFQYSIFNKKLFLCPSKDPGKWKIIPKMSLTNMEAKSSHDEKDALQQNGFDLILPF